jgi:membrane-bound lytic murein transglycosylase B
MHDHGARQTLTDITRRAALRLTAAFLVTFAGPASAAQKAKEKAKEKTKEKTKQVARATFEQWVESFKPRALARGVSDATYTRVMRGIKPDTSVYALDRSQPEFTEKLWQYINRRVSDWRITEGREKAKDYDALLKRIEQDFGVAPPVMLGIWGVESAYGDPYVQKNHMRPIFPALGALAWGAPLLGTGAAQRAGHRRARLGHTGGDARLLGRRHGAHPVDA